MTLVYKVLLFVQTVRSDKLNVYFYFIDVTYWLLASCSRYFFRTK